MLKAKYSIAKIQIKMVTYSIGYYRVQTVKSSTKRLNQLFIS